MRATRLLIVTGFVLLLCAAASAQTPAIAGFWVVQDTNSGSWQQWWDGGPNGHKPNLRPDMTKLNDEEDARLRAGNVVDTSRGRGAQAADCGTGNLAMSFASSGAQEIVVSPTQIKLGPQMVYTDGRDHADAKNAAYKPSGNGHSTGRWDGSTLIVDTVGFPARMCDSRTRIMRLTGGGRAKETTHLTQRVRLVDADTLQIAFTWDDPSIYVEPYWYTYTFKRIPKPADDPAQEPPKRQFLTDKYWPR